MTNRREFLQSSAALSAASLASGPAFGKSRKLALMAAIIDTRFAATARFGSQAAAFGLPVHAIDGDITKLWLQHLDQLWSAQPLAVAGLTARPALFCLEQLAWDKGLRVIYHAEHKLLNQSEVQHTVLTPLQGIDAALLTQAGDRWPALAAEALNNISTLPLVSRPSQACMPAAHNDDALTLHSWVLAPLV